jgi:multiple sugar transport system substrate-binding protein
MTDDEYEAVIKEFMAANPNVKVEMEYVDYNALHDKISTAMAATPPGYDFIMVDTIWYPEFVKAGYLSDETSKITSDMRDKAFKTAWNTVTVSDKVYGMPWLLDTKYLYYNKDILKQAGFDNPPTTWEELITQAKAIKDKGLVEFPIDWSWGQIEASICDFTVLVAGNGGKTVDDAGKPTFNDAKGVAVLDWMVKSIDSGLSNPASVTSDEEAVRNVFSSGKAAFALNWLYMEDQANFNDKESQVVGKVGMTLMPVFESQAKAGLKSASVDGSSGFSVIATSPNQDAAWAFVQYLTSEPTQMKYSAHQLPIWLDSYQGDNLKKLEAIGPSQAITVPLFSQQFQYAVGRSRVPYYIESSKALQLALQEALTKQKTPQAALDEAAATWTKLASK